MLRILLLLLLLTLPGAAGACGQHSDRFIPDGDTIVLANRTVVRLLGVDAPETARGHRPAQRFARESRMALQRMVRSRDLVIQTTGRDRYGRSLAVVRLANQTLVNEAMVEQGLAFFYWFDDLPEGLARRLMAAQTRAMDAGRGFWTMLLELPEAQEVWVGNKRSRRACPARWPGASRVTTSNRREFRSLREMFGAGYAPARDCTPWPEEGF